MSAFAHIKASQSAMKNRGERFCFDLVLAACALFTVLTALAMPFYAGGTSMDAHSVGYHFWLNFFSDLGRTTARNGAPNATAALLFKIALSAAGAALATFHLTLARALWRTATARALLADCAIIAVAACGVAAGTCFCGVAINTADLASYRHGFFVVWAFRFFLLASLCAGAVISKRPEFPRLLVKLVGVFAILLFAYLLLIWRGPNTDTALGLAIQATSQKIVVYAAVGCVAAQAWVMRGLERRGI